MLPKGLRLIPGRNRPKQALPIVLVAILAGCGGSAAPAAQQVSGPGYRFAAPHGWTVSRTRLTVAAAHGADVVEVSTFPLMKRYRTELFAPVEPELRRQLQKVAGGPVAPAGSVVAAGVRSHVYRVSVGGHVDEYTFVLVGLREYQLLCRASDAGSKPCDQLQRSFRLAADSAA